MIEKQKSNFGDIPDDPYLVFESNKGLRGKQITACYILRPAREKPALTALKAFITALQDENEEDPRLDKLRNWIETLDKMWS